MLTARSTGSACFPSLWSARNLAANGHTRERARRAETDHRRRIVQDRFEPNISPADYPLIRLVPSRLTPSARTARGLLRRLIYFGAQTAKSEGLETVLR